MWPKYRQHEASRLEFSPSSSRSFVCDDSVSGLICFGRSSRALVVASDRVSEEVQCAIRRRTTSSASLGEDEFHGVFDRSRRSRGRSLVKTLDLTDHNSCTRGFRFF
ncbi:uncharacterized protein LOC108838012 [Raphanus sativus]|uniref:Uncharacterized protein LOC108838012 n=1 Tax=Raphanus sativus TaxID=3726 RepID=A0A6J0M399_RAPSA|nr:uncharacterized protein LOC108838012 [Raphanus sativus]